MSARFKSHSRRGYTLFELLLTLSLAAALLALISTAIGLFEKFSSAGRARAEQSQIARALLDRIETDLRCIVYREQPADMDQETDAIVPLGELNVEQEFKVKHPNAEYEDASLGVIGDERNLLLHVDRASGSRSQNSESSAGPAGIHYVIWTISPNPSGNNAAGRLTAQSSSSHKNAGAAQTGLARFTVARLPLRINRSVLFSPGAVLDGEKQGSVLASEVKSIRFRYRDQAGWQDAWDSVVAKRLPRAIEMTLEFEPRREIPNHSNSLRVVLPIILSEPFVPQLDFPAASGGQ